MNLYTRCGALISVATLATFLGACSDESTPNSAKEEPLSSSSVGEVPFNSAVDEIPSSSADSAITGDSSSSAEPVDSPTAGVSSSSEESSSTAESSSSVESSSSALNIFSSISLNSNLRVPEGGLFRWDGADHVYKIETGLDAANKNGGYWFNYDDYADGGTSIIEWAVEPGNEIYDDALDPIIDYCGGVCGTFTLDKGSLTYDPFAGLGFNVAGVPEGSTAADVADISAWGGLCVAYSSTHDIQLELGFSDADNVAIGYSNPFATLPKSTEGIVKCLRWKNFHSMIWSEEALAKAVKHVATIKFKFQGKDGTKGEFNIMSISSYVEQ